MATDVVARLKLRAESFSREVRKAFDDVPNEADRAGREAGKRLGSGLGAGLKAGIAGLAVGTIVQEVAQLTMRAVDFGVELGNNARALNTNVEELQAYREAASEVNVTHQRLDDGLQQLLQSMIKAEGGNKDAIASFKGLSVELRDADGQAKTTTAVMGEVIDQLRRIPDPLRQAQYGAALFGDQWQNIAPILQAGSEGLQQLTGDILATGDALTTKEVQALEWVNSELERMKNTLAVDVSRVVAQNADSIAYMASRIYAVGNAAVWATGRLAEFLSMGATKPGGDLAVEQNRRIQGKHWRGQAIDMGDGLALTRPGTRQFAKGGKGGGRSYDDAERIARAADLREMQPFVRPVIDGYSPARLGGGGGGKPRKAAGAGGGLSKEAREAEKLRAEYDRMRESLARGLADQREAADVEELRAAGLERAADQQEALNALNDKYRDVAGKTADEVAKRYGITIDKAQELVAMLDALRNGEAVKIDIDYDKKFADAIGKDAEKKLAALVEDEAQALQQQWDRTEAMAHKQLQELGDFYFDLFDGNTRNIWDNFKRLGLNALAELAASQTMKLLNGEKVDIGGSLKELFSAQKGDLLGGMSKGALASSIAGAIGIKQSKTGAMVGSAAGSLFFGPLGGAIGGLLGGTIGGLFKKAPKGSAVITSADEGGFTVNGNKAGVRQDLTGAASSVQDGLRRVADMLNADLGAFRVSIGEYKGWYRVSGSGSASVGDKKYPKRAGSDLLYDGQDAQEAMRVAILNAIQDGAIQGISQAAQNILKKGKDIEGAVEKALMIEELPKALKARLDPLGAELDAIDAKFTKLADVLREGGASAEQIAQARQLWELERADAVAQIGQASATLRDYLKTLRIGSDSPLSLRTQAAEAEAAMAPYIAQIRAAEEAKAKYDQLVAGGGSAADVKAAKDAAAAAAAAIDQSGFRDSAALFLDVSRALGGSTKSFFDQFDRIQGLTNSAIALVENAVPLRGDAKDPFAELTAKATQSMANILDGHTALLQQIANGIGGGGYGGGGAFIGGDRNFVRSL